MLNKQIIIRIVLIISLILIGACSSNNVENVSKQETAKETKTNTSQLNIEKLHKESKVIYELFVNNNYDEMVAYIDKVSDMEIDKRPSLEELDFFKNLSWALKYKNEGKLNDYIGTLAKTYYNGIPAELLEILNNEKMIAKKKLIELIDDRKLMEVVQGVGVWDGDPEFKALKNYAGALYTNTRDESAFNSYLSNIPENYNGILSDKINELVNSNKSGIAQEKDRQQEELLRNKTEKNSENPGGVRIGMSQEEVLTEGWGQPEDINRTTTSYGVSEQWVYPNYNYLYFEDGILTTIQN